jgi:hypothetical protein
MDDDVAYADDSSGSTEFAKAFATSSATAFSVSEGCVKCIFTSYDIFLKKLGAYFSKSCRARFAPDISPLIYVGNRFASPAFAPVSCKSVGRRDSNCDPEVAVTNGRNSL